MKWILSIHLYFFILKTAWSWHWPEYFGERCQSSWILNDIEGLRRDIRDNVFGQPFIDKALVPLLKHHIGVGLHEGYIPKKALVLSFHGSTGVGKTFVAQLIAKHFYRRGHESKFYKHISLGQSWLMNEDDLRTKVTNTVRECDRAVFVFDEIEKMSEGTFEIIKSFLDFHPDVEDVDYRKSIFIFISNIGVEHINNLAESFWRKGINREDYELSDFHNVLHNSVYNEQSGLKKTNIVKNFLIDLYLPFLPLEKSHVEKCIFAEANALRINLPPNSLKIILNSVVFNQQEEQIFSYSGCKTVSSLVKIHGHDEL